MNKYSGIEIETAKNLLEHGYRWINKSCLGSILAYENKPTENPRTFIPGKNVCTDCVPIFESIKSGDEPTCLESIVHPQILDDAEKRYLSAVIRPFRDGVYYIKKISSNDMRKEYIDIGFEDGDDICLPWFIAGTMYKGMEIDKGYALEELGL